MNPIANQTHKKSIMRKLRRSEGAGIVEYVLIAVTASIVIYSIFRGISPMMTNATSTLNNNFGVSEALSTTPSSNNH